MPGQTTTRSFCFAIVALSLGLTTVAHAQQHGGRPIGRNVVTHPDFPDFQALISSDLGIHFTSDSAQFYWICEDMVGFDVLDLALAGDASALDARVWLTAGQGVTQEDVPRYIDGIYRSTDGGCNFAPVGGTLADQWGAALDTHPARQDEVLVATNHIERPNGVAISEDAGLTWAWTDLADINVPFLALVRSPSHPEVVYTSWDTGLARSDDGGRTWTRFGEDLPERPTDRLIAQAVHPTNPDILYFFHIKSGGGGLVVTRDGGDTLTELYVAGTRDISALAVKVGADGQITLTVGTILGDIYRSPDDGETWEEAFAPIPIHCLAQDLSQPDALLVCSNIFFQFLPPQIALGRSTDGLETVEPYFTYANGTYHQCDDQSQVNTICIPLDTPDAGSDGDDGDVLSADAGTPDSGDAGVLPDMPGDDLVTPKPAPPKDCSCATPSAPTPSSALLIPLLVGVAWLRRRST